LRVYDLYSRFKRPLYITELSVGTAGEGSSGQPVQAEVVRNFYRLFFSVERMAGITWWNLADATPQVGRDPRRQNTTSTTKIAGRRASSTDRSPQRKPTAYSNG
jgi:hypothetical protein